MNTDNTRTGILGHGISPSGMPMTFARYEMGKEPKAVTYWLTRPYQERWAAAEKLRQIIYGYDPAVARMERTFRVVQRGES